METAEPEGRRIVDADVKTNRAAQEFVEGVPTDQNGSLRVRFTTALG